jgi:hypothetical protein
LSTSFFSSSSFATVFAGVEIEGGAIFGGAIFGGAVVGGALEEEVSFSGGVEDEGGLTAPRIFATDALAVPPFGGGPFGGAIEDLARKAAAAEAA